MAHACDRRPGSGQHDVPPEDGRPQRAGCIMLATLASTPFDGGAAELALDLALGRPADLVVVNVADFPAGGRGPRTDLGDPPAVAKSLHEPVQAALAAGVDVTALRTRSLRPASTLVDMACALEPSVVVFGPDLARLSALRGLSQRSYRRALRMLEVGTSCLLWAPAPDQPDLAPRCRSPIAALAMGAIDHFGQQRRPDMRRPDIWW